VNETTKGVRAHQTQQPQNQQDDKDCPKHKVLLSIQGATNYALICIVGDERISVDTANSVEEMGTHSILKIDSP
jgi:hypothetical protein